MENTEILLRKNKNWRVETISIGDLRKYNTDYLIKKLKDINAQEIDIIDTQVIPFPQDNNPFYALVVINMAVTRI